MNERYEYICKEIDNLNSNKKSKPTTQTYHQAIREIDTIINKKSKKSNYEKFANS